MTSNFDQSYLYSEFISKLNSKDINPGKVSELKSIALSIENIDIKRIILIDKLYSDNYLSKIIAIDVLAPELVKDEEIRKLLLNSLENNNHASVKSSIINVILPHINKYKDIELATIKLLSINYEIPAVKKLLIKSLAPRLIKPEIKNVIINKLEDDSSSVRVAVVESLSFYLDNEEILDSILKKLKDNDTSVRIAAVKAIGQKSRQRRSPK